MTADHDERAALLERILSAWSDPDSGNVAGYGRTHGEPGVRCADFAAYVRSRQSALAARTRELESERGNVAEVGRAHEFERSERKRLEAELEKLRAVISACHHAVGEHEGSDDATLAEGIRMRVEAMAELERRLVEAEAKRANLERRTVEFLEKGFGESSTCPNGCDCNDCRARALLAEWKEVSRG